MPQPQENVCSPVCEPHSHSYPPPQGSVCITPPPPSPFRAAYEEQTFETQPPPLPTPLPTQSPPPALHLTNEQSRGEEQVMAKDKKDIIVAPEISTTYKYSVQKQQELASPQKFFETSKKYSHKHTQTSELDLKPVEQDTGISAPISATSKLVKKSLADTKHSTIKSNILESQINTGNASIEINTRSTQSTTTPVTKFLINTTQPSTTKNFTTMTSTSTTTTITTHSSFIPPLTKNDTTTTTTITTTAAVAAAPISSKDMNVTSTVSFNTTEYKPYHPSYYYPPPPPPTKVVPEPRQTYENEGRPRFMGPAERRPAFEAGRNGRVPLAARFDTPFQPLKSTRLPSPFSGHGAARAVSEQGPSAEVKYHTGINNLFS